MDRIHRAHRHTGWFDFLDRVDPPKKKEKVEVKPPALQAHDGESNIDVAPSKKKKVSPEERVALARKVANDSQNPKAIDAIDTFRQGLSPEEQQRYDAQVEQLRHDDRIDFDFRDGAVDDLTTRELALRGMVAATFGRPEDLEASIRTATNSTFDRESGEVRHTPGEGKLKIIIYPSAFDPAEVDETDGHAEPISGGLKTSYGSIVASQDFLYAQLPNRDNLFVHEFSHVVQGASTHEDGQSEGQRFPDDFGFARKVMFEALFRAGDTQDLLESKGLNHELGGESFPTIQHLFREQPADLKRESPRLYELMVSYSGVDPLAGTLTDEGRARYG